MRIFVKIGIVPDSVNYLNDKGLTVYVIEMCEIIDVDK